MRVLFSFKYHSRFSIANNLLQIFCLTTEEVQCNCKSPLFFEWFQHGLRAVGGLLEEGLCFDFAVSLLAGGLVQRLQQVGRLPTGGVVQNQDRYLELFRRAINPGYTKVWPLTQFYSVGFSKSRIGGKNCVSNKRTIKACVSCF